MLFPVEVAGFGACIVQRRRAASGTAAGMFRRGSEPVNLRTPFRSTIESKAIAAVLASALTGRSPARTVRLPWHVRFGFWLLPPRCIACGGEGDLGAIDLCAACLETWPHRATGELGIAFDYREPVAAALRALKFDGDRRPARVLGTLLGLRIATFAARDRSSRPVAIGAAARRDNVRDAFVAVPTAAFAMKKMAASARVPLRIALLDDVSTTGATLAAASAALSAAASAAGVPLQVQCCAVAATAKSSAMPTNTTNPT
jgi:predicted amidophosphoribosyltransferase